MPRRPAGFLFVIAFLLALQIHAVDHLPRIWTNSMGIKIEATFVRAEDDKVTLLMNNGQMVTMSGR